MCIFPLGYVKCIYECCDVDILYSSQTFLCGKVYYSNPIIITNLMQTLIPIYWFENIFSIYFCIEIS
jgi:hypothetical protein